MQIKNEMIIRDKLTFDFLSWNLGGQRQWCSQPGCTMQVPGSFTQLIFLIIRSPGDSNAYSKLETTDLGSIFEESLNKIQKLLSEGE